MRRGYDFRRVNATDYDDLRQGYAAEAVGWVAERAGLTPGSRVVDLAAGTGQLSRGLARLGLEVVAIEPAANMRSVLSETLPTVRAIAGTGETMPLTDSSADAVVVGNAFHHLDADRAFAEIGRVLRPGGALALFWAGYDPEEHRLDPIVEVVDATVSASPIVAAHRSWSEDPCSPTGFSPFERRSFPTTHVIASSRIADLFATSSDVASLDRVEREALLDRIRELAGVLPETLELSARTDVHLCFWAAEEGT